VFVEGFDGLDFVVLPVSDVAPLVALYHSSLGFEIQSDGSPGTEGIASLLGLSDGLSRVVHLTRGAGVGGGIVLVESGAVEPSPHAVPRRRRGAYALDFYLRDAAATEGALVDAGWTFTSAAVHYALPGTTIPVRERMLVQQHSDLLHAMVQHRPGGTRSVLGNDPRGWCSEVVAVVVLTADLSGARRFATEALGAQEYFAGTFNGPAIEEMLRFGEGEGLEAALYRGPTSSNARLEFARPVDGAGQLIPLADASDRRQVLPGLLVEDLDRALDRLNADDHGEIFWVGDVRWLGSRRRAARFDSAYDVSLLLLDGGTSGR
jgi:catechol 2,3-dioxygenase-like lactoylglutathione lyase family enzyme